MCDHLGTPTQGYNEEGALIWERQLDSYGKIKMLQGDEGFCNYIYQGQTLDAETGLAYNRFRYYDPEEGVYISQDPIGLDGGMAFYGYVHDTNTWVDIFGLACSVAQRKANQKNGKKAEDLVYNKLKKNPNVDILGRQVTIHTKKGVRYADVLIQNKATGQIVAVEVKSGKAVRNSKQIKKDGIINSGDGTFGKNGFDNPNNPLIGTATVNTTSSVTQVALWKI